jgi:hypothetical protein
MRMKMNRKFYVLIAIFLLGCMSAAAQEFELYGGYGYLGMNSGGGQGTNFNGWDGGVQWNLRPNVSLAADIGGTYGKQDSVTLHHVSYLVGPRLNQQFRQVRLFEEAMLGAAQLRASQGTQSDQSFGFAAAFGGGADVRLNRHFNYRIARVDYLITRHAGSRQNNFALTSGMVWRF